LDLLDSALAPQTFRALIVSGSLAELPLPERAEQSEVALALAGDEHHRGVSFRGARRDSQTILIVKEIAPERYAGVFAWAAPGLSFPHQQELEQIVGTLSYQPVEAESSPGPIDFWVEHGQTIRRPEQEPPLYYDLLAPEDEAGAPESGWPVLALAQTSGARYDSIAQDELGIVVKPQFEWTSFERDRQILEAILAEIGAEYPLDDQRLLLHGCSVGGQFAFEYTLAEPERVMGAVVMAPIELEVPPRETWQIPFAFFYGDRDPFYNAQTRAVIASMQRKMESVALYLDTGQAHVCDPALAIEAIQAFLAE
jgi:dienelactone hydrolase